MAKINTKFTFQDDVSSGIRKVQEELMRTSEAMAELASGLDGAEDGMKKTKKETKETADSVGHLNTKLLNFNATLQAYREISGIFNKVKSGINDCVTAYSYQAEQELKLTTIMRQRMNATDEDIQYIKDLASAQQQVGIYGDEMILQGAQELASFTSNKEAIATLIPAMNNLVAQQYSYSASGHNFQQTADMMGKVLSGQTGALSRLGYVFSEEEKAMLSNGDEMQRASVLAKIITDNVGEMNEALAGTDAGSIQRMTNTIGDLKEEIGSTLQSLKSSITKFTSTITADFLRSIKRLVDKVVPLINNIIETLQKIYSAVAPYIERLGNFITETLGGALTWIQDHIHEIIDAVILLASVFVAKAMICAVSWALANWQLLLVISIVAGIIGIMRSWGKTTEDLGEYIGGAFGGAFIVIYNIVADIYNLFMSVYDLIVNITHHPLRALANFLMDIFAFFFDALATITQVIDGIGRLFGKDWKVSDALHGVAEGFRDVKIEDDMAVHERMEKKTTDDFMAGIRAGSEIGGNIGAGIDNALAGIEDTMNSIGDAGTIKNGIMDAFDFNSDGTLSVSDKSLVNIADDYLDLLSQKAISNFDLNFSQVTPEVKIGDITVNNNADLDALVNSIVEGVETASYSSLKG